MGVIDLYDWCEWDLWVFEYLSVVVVLDVLIYFVDWIKILFDGGWGVGWGDIYVIGLIG